MQLLLQYPILQLKRKQKKVLLKIKTKYQEEIHHWEHLSNTLKALQDRTIVTAASYNLDTIVTAASYNHETIETTDLQRHYH